MGRNTKLSYAWAVSLSLVYVKNVTASTQRRDQECPPPAGGCSGPGLWDDQSCQCLCVENYCYDSMAGTCSTVSGRYQLVNHLCHHLFNALMLSPQ
jgi:hypothetical protein